MIPVQVIADREAGQPISCASRIAANETSCAPVKARPAAPGYIGEVLPPEAVVLHQPVPRRPGHGLHAAKPSSAKKGSPPSRLRQAVVNLVTVYDDAVGQGAARPGQYFVAGEHGPHRQEAQSLRLPAPRGSPASSSISSAEHLVPAADARAPASPPRATCWAMGPVGSGARAARQRSLTVAREPGKHH